MKKEALKRIFDFLEEKEEKKPKIYGSIAWKILFNDPIIKEDLIVQGDLDISTLNITHLPKGLKIIGNADFRFSSLKTFPKNLFVEGSLNFEWTRFKSLSDGLYIGRNLFLSDSDIETLPKGLKVGGILFISDTPLAKLSDEKIREMIKPGFIEGRIIR
jgi:hypothetical protein